MGLFELAKQGLYKGTYRAILTDSLVNKFAGVLFDSLTQHIDSYSSNATKHAIEEGAPITDNVFNDPMTLSITGVFKQPGFSILTGAEAVLNKSPAMRFSILLKWRDDKKLLKFAYNGVFENMVITSLNRDVNAGLGRSMQISMTLKKITIASAVTGIIGNTGVTEKIPVPISGAG